jgi:serine/threonine protein kinase
MEPLSANDPRAIGEFALRARLGSGGMGRVYLGFSPGGRAVAIKVVHPELARDPEFLQRFGREVAAARAVSGVYTAPVVAYGLNDDPPWMATAFVPGPPLADVVTRHGPLPEAAVWRLAAGLAEALRAVHDCNLVHRDLKPSNVLLAPDGPHVIDFGISRAFDGTALTSAGMVVGTPGYMSPEQAEGQVAGAPSDVFSLGCVLAYAATGLAPFGSGSAASVLYKVVTAEPDLRPVPERLRQVIAACLSKNPSARAGLAQLAAMISALGPATPPALGSFWPEPVASYVLGDQAYPTPTQVSQPPMSQAPIGQPPMGQVPVSPAQSGWTPEVSAPVSAAQQAPWQPVPTATPLGGRPQDALGNAALGSSAQSRTDVPWTGMRLPSVAQPGMAAQAGLSQPDLAQPDLAPPGTPPPGPTYGATGHAPMVADGYYAAAAGGLSPGSLAQPQYPQAPAGQPPWQQSGGAAPQTGAQYGAPSWGQPSGPTFPPQQQSMTPWPQPAQGTPWSQQQPGQGTPNPLAQYTPGRRRPTKAEIPGAVITATRVMYLGAVVTVLYAIFGGFAEGRDDNLAALSPGTQAGDNAASMGNDLAATAVLGGAIGVVCWLLIATSCRRGHGWTRIAATILLALHTVGALTVLVATHGDPAVRVTTIAVWVIGLAAVILLWGQQAGAFFLAWRRTSRRTG